MFIAERVQVLREHNITPVLVFDGGALPLKKQTQSDRAEYVDCFLPYFFVLMRV